MTNKFFKILALTVVLLSGVVGCAELAATGFYGVLPARGYGVYDPIVPPATVSIQMDWTATSPAMAASQAAADEVLRIAQQDYNNAVNRAQEAARKRVQWLDGIRKACSDYRHGLHFMANKPDSDVGQQAYVLKWQELEKTQPRCGQ